MTNLNILKALLEEHKRLGVTDILRDEPVNRLSSVEETLDLSDILPKASRNTPRTEVSSSFKPSVVPVLSQQESTISAKKLAESAKTLDELKEKMMSFDGCSLKRTATNMVFGDGNPKAKIMLIGEAPGADEDRLGKPFVGLSGQLLDRMFATIGLTRQENLYITNIIPWRPPGNRQPTPAETAICLPFVEKHIELLSPDYLIMVGGTSAKALLNTKDGIMKLRGKWRNYQPSSMDKTDGDKQIKAMAIFHPAYLLRSPGQKKEVWKDLLFIKKTLQDTGIILDCL